jgi:hypothetical protein
MDRESSRHAVIYLPAARRFAAVIFLLATLVVGYFAVWLGVLVLEQGHFPTAAGGPVAALFIGGLALLAAYTARLAVRGARCRVTADASGIVVHNLKDDLRFAWSQIEGFDVATDSWGMWGSLKPNPYVVARIVARDGSPAFIEATRLGGVVWRRRRRREEVAGCVAQLERLRQHALAGVPALS